MAAFRRSPKPDPAPPPAEELGLPPEPAAPQRPPDAADGVKRAVIAFIDSAGTQLGASELADACRAASVAQLRSLAVWVPAGSGRTVAKCDRAREIVQGVLSEKDAR